MAHLIEEFADGTASFFSARKPAWHSLGTVTENALNAETALQVAQMDWIVEKAPLQAVINGEIVDVKDRFATVRKHPKNDTYDALGVVGDRYEIIQNHEAFKILDDIVDQSGAVFETAGAIKNGKRVFVSMELPQHIQFNNGDTAGLHLLATNSHDGKTACQIAVTPVRVVCQNTLTMALGSARSSFSIRHTKNADRRIEQARQALNLTFTYVDAFQMEVDELIATEYSNSDFFKYIERVFPLENVDNSLSVKNDTERKSVLMNLWKSPTQENSANTAWGAYNTIVEYVDWFQNTKSDKVRAERVIASHALQRVKNKALALI